MPLPGFGGLEMQMTKRAADAIANGDNALAITLPGSKADRYVHDHCIPKKNMKVKMKYLDPIAIKKLGEVFVNHDTDICVVSQSYHLSIAVAARNLYSNDTAIVFYQQMQSGIKKKDFFHNWVYRNVDGSVVLTQRMKRELNENTIFPKEKISVIPCGIDISRFSEKRDKITCRKEFYLPEDKFIYGYIARIDPHKAQSTAIKAFAKANITDTYLIFCGDINNAEYFNSLKEMIDQYDLNNKIKFLPFTKKVPELMQAMDIFIMPSRSETLGLVTIEAMASGKPVIATRSGGVPEIIDHNENGLLFPHEDHVTLAEYMMKLHSDPGLCAKLGEDAKIKAKSKFDYKKQSDKFFDFCNSIYSGRNGKPGSNEN